MIKKPAVAVALLLFLIAGCGGVPVDSPSAPLGSGGDPFRECVPDLSATVMTDGITVLANHSKGTVIVEQVRFYGVHHLQFVRAVAVPIRYDAIGYSAGWPPAQFLTLPGVRWDKRVAAIGARVPPGPTLLSRRNLVIGMRPTAHKGISAGVQVLYRENGHQYELRTHTRTVVVEAANAFGC